VIKWDFSRRLKVTKLLLQNNVQGAPVASERKTSVPHLLLFMVVIYRGVMTAFRSLLRALKMNGKLLTNFVSGQTFLLYRRNGFV
jgi:hypothetical protein